VRWGRVTENLIRANGISLGASGVALTRCDTVRTSWYDKWHPPRAQVVEIAAASVHAERLQGALSLRLRRSAQMRCYDIKRQEK
jgi:hypothetical protein